MMTGIFSYDESIDPGNCTVYLADRTATDDAGKSLNKGIRSLIDSGCDNIVVIGRGCKAQLDTVSDHMTHLERHRYPLITCGRILHRNEHWKDFRELGSGRHLNLFGPNGTIVQNSAVLTSGYGISVANFGLNRAAIDRLNRFTQLYFDNPGPFPELSGEQPYGYGKVLSLCAWCARVTMFMLPGGKNNAVLYESEGDNPYSVFSGHAYSGNTEIALMNEKLDKNPLDLDFFDSANDY